MKAVTQEKPATLVELLVPNILANAASSVIESLKINSISEQVRSARRMVIKRRNSHSARLAEMANLYFSWSDIPIRFWSTYIFRSNVLRSIARFGI